MSESGNPIGREMKETSKRITQHYICTPDKKRQQAKQYDPKGEVEDYHPRNLSAIDLFFILKT